MRLTSFAIFVALLTTACSDDLDESQSPCPCAEGFHCDLSGGDPGICREGPLLVATLIDRFDDDSFDDWEHIDGEVELENGRLLAYRTATTGSGAVRRPIAIPAGPFVLEADVALYTESSWANLYLSKAGTDSMITVQVSNNAEGTNLTGFFFVAGQAYNVHSDTTPAPAIAQEGTPEKDRTYHIKLVYDGKGGVEYLVDGESIGKATIGPLPAFDRIELRSGQNSFENHGAYFDNVILRTLPGATPTLVPDENNPVREAAGIVVDILWDVDDYKALVRHDWAFSLEASSTGSAWTEVASSVIGASITGRNYQTYAVMLPTSDGYRAWINGADGSCHEYSSIFSATSADATTWSSGELVLDYGAPSAFDSRGYYGMSILHDGERYHLFAHAMWTTGSGDLCEAGDHWRHNGIAHATSVDGVTWETHGLALYPGLPGELDDRNASLPRVIRHAGHWQMLYHGSDTRGGARLMYASSSDGFAWIKHGPLSVEGSAAAFLLRDNKRELFYGCGGLLCRGTLQD